jgi:hypothetical protein
MEDNNFGWSEAQFSDLQKQIKEGNNTVFYKELMPLKKNKNGSSYPVLGEATEFCVLETTVLLCRWLGESATKLSNNQKEQIKKVLMETLKMLEQAIHSDTVQYGDLKGWVRDNTFEALKTKYKEQNFGWTPDRFLALKTQLLTTDTHKSDTAAFRADVNPFIGYFISYVRNLAKGFRLTTDEEGLILDAVISTLTRFEQRMDDSKGLRPLTYGNLKDWAAGSAYSKFLALRQDEQVRSGVTGAIDGIVLLPPNEEEEEDLMVGLVAKTLADMPDEAKYFYRTTLKLYFWEAFTFQILQTI